jgi:hypothetical protein
MSANQPASITQVAGIRSGPCARLLRRAARVEKRSDFAYGDGKRWIEVAPRDSALALALVSSAEGTATPTAAARCALATNDIDSLVARLRPTE